MKKALILILALAAYLNIGWALGTYFYDEVARKIPESVVSQILSGPRNVLSQSDRPAHMMIGRTSTQVFWSILWPALTLLIGVLWLFYGIYYLLWLVFAGGIVKLLGLA